MERYDVYSLGNALLDIEFNIQQDFLKEAQIEKGISSLVDEQGHNTLLGKVQSESPSHIASGGSAANTMMALQAFGGKGFYSCRLGSDEAGDRYLQEMNTMGLRSNYDAKTASRSGVTGKCIVMVTPDAERTMKTFLGACCEFSKQDLYYPALTSSEYLYIEGYLLGTDTAFEAAKQAKLLARSNGVKVALTLSDPVFVGIFRERFEELIGHDGVDLLFCNEREMQIFTQSTSMVDGLERLKSIAKTFALTRGKSGSTLFDGSQYHYIPAYPVQAVDTLGAGDIYAGAFLFALTQGMSWCMAGYLASRAAGEVVSQPGPRLTVKQIEGILQEVLGDVARKEGSSSSRNSPKETAEA
jgi:sugar/nucleoside kinase (ribokinase family)